MVHDLGRRSHSPPRYMTPSFPTAMRRMEALLQHSKRVSSLWARHGTAEESFVYSETRPVLPPRPNCGPRSSTSSRPHDISSCSRRRRRRHQDGSIRRSVGGVTTAPLPQCSSGWPAANSLGVQPAGGLSRPKPRLYHMRLWIGLTTSPCGWTSGRSDRRVTPRFVTLDSAMLLPASQHLSGVCQGMT